MWRKIKWCNIQSTSFECRYSLAAAGSISSSIKELFLVLYPDFLALHGFEHVLLFVYEWNNHEYTSSGHVRFHFQMILKDLYVFWISQKTLYEGKWMPSNSVKMRISPPHEQADLSLNEGLQDWLSSNLNCNQWIGSPDCVFTFGRQL